MLILALSAAFVGFVHSLAPGHWLPVVLMVKARRWSLNQAALGALVAASGHIFVSLSLGVLASIIGKSFFSHHLHEVEEYAGWVLVTFGVCYALYSHFRHRQCHGHEHHGPVPRAGTAPYVFLFSLGLSPCFAVLPIFATAVGLGTASLLFSMASFSVGVIAAFLGGSLLVSKGLVRLDHPVLEHHGDLITGLGVSAMGVILLFIPHSHPHF